jgi:hypothetical protein
MGKNKLLLKLFITFSILLLNFASLYAAPTITSATIPLTGDRINILFSETVTRNAETGWTLTMTVGPVTMNYSSGSNSNTLVYTLSRIIDSGETGTISWNAQANTIEDLSGNDLATDLNRSVINDSTGGGSSSSNAFLTGVIIRGGKLQSYGASLGGLLNQTIILNVSTTIPFTVGDANRLITCTSTSGLDCSFSTNFPGTCDVVYSSPNYYLRANDAGQCWLYADQAGNGSYNPAPQASKSVVISGAGGQQAQYFGETTAGDGTQCTNDSCPSLISYATHSNYSWASGTRTYMCPGTGTRTINGLEVYSSNDGTNGSFRAAMWKLDGTLQCQGSAAKTVTSGTPAWVAHAAVSGTCTCTGGTYYKLGIGIGAAAHINLNYTTGTTGNTIFLGAGTDHAADGWSTLGSGTNVSARFRVQAHVAAGP